MTKIIKNLIILSLIVGSIYFVARLAGVADLLDRYVIWVVLVICIHAFYLWGFDHDDNVYMSQSDMQGIKESLPKFESNIKLELKDIREQIVKLKLDIKTQPDPDEVKLAVSEEVKKGIKNELNEINEKLKQLRLHASSSTPLLGAIQGDSKAQFRNMRDTILGIKNEIKQAGIDALALNEHMGDNIKSGLHDMQKKIDEIKSDAGSMPEHIKAMLGDVRTEMIGMQKQIEEIRLSASSPEMLDDLKNAIKAELHEIQSLVKKDVASGASNQLELKNDIISVIKTELNNLQNQIQLIQNETLGQLRNDADLIDVVNAALLDIHRQIRQTRTGNGSAGIDDESMGETNAEFRNIQKQIQEIEVASSIQKRYIEQGASCEVTFTLPQVTAPGARKVALVGDFNNWDNNRMVMNKLENGDFTLPLVLESGREYRFKYLIDDERWENDRQADKYLPNPNGYDDSVVLV